MTTGSQDRFWSFIEHVIFPEDRWSSSAVDAERVVELLGLPPGATILDMPCGLGRHSISLAKLGFDVIACDRTASYLDKAAKRAENEKVEVEWHLGDMREFRPPRPVDAVINLYTSFGYFQDPEQDRAAARSFFEALKPGGRLVIESMGKEMLGPIFRDRVWFEGDDGSLLLHHRTIGDHLSWIRERWIVVRDGEQYEERFEHRLYSARELVDLLTEVGFVDLETYGSLAGGNYDFSAEQLVVTARRG